MASKIPDHRIKRVRLLITLRLRSFEMMWNFGHRIGELRGCSLDQTTFLLVGQTSRLLHNSVFRFRQWHTGLLNFTVNMYPNLWVYIGVYIGGYKFSVIFIYCPKHVTRIMLPKIIAWVESRFYQQ